MAKLDFCFTYYDGDAARDMAHMNRLARGGYTDIIISQRKFGSLTLKQIKMILGNDYEEIWPAIELVMVKDEEERYYIEWLDNSITQMKGHSGHQSENGKKGGRPPKINPNESENKPEIKQTESEVKTNSNPNKEKIKPLGDGDGNVYEDENGSETGDENEPAFAKQRLLPQMHEIWKASIPHYTPDKHMDYPALSKISMFIFNQAHITNGYGDPAKEILCLNTFQLIADQVNREQFWIGKPLKAIAGNIQEFYNKIKNPDNGKKELNGRKQHPTNSAIKEALARKLNQK
jgi:hypothetical protein